MRSATLTFVYLLAAMIALPLCSAASAASLTPTRLRCEYLADPLGIDVPQPRLSWMLESADVSARGQSQTAYQILVATTPEKLAADQADLWDSGKIASDQSIHIAYAGKPLASRAACFWKVRVWDQAGQASSWSPPARWTMGLLQPSDWKAQWIGLDALGPESAPPPPAVAKSQWIWFAEGQPAASTPVGKRYFRRTFTLPPNAQVTRATCQFTADNSCVVFINGREAGRGQAFNQLYQADLAKDLKSGPNTLAIVADNAGDAPNPAGLIAVIRVEFAQGQPLLIASDPQWRAADKESANWTAASFDDSAWPAAKALGAYGIAPWGAMAKPDETRLAARMLRRQFDVSRKVRRATAYISGLGLSELYLNGQKVGDHVLSPGLTEYTRRVYYVTHDVTAHLQQGPNAVGVILGNGRYFAPRAKVPTNTRTFGFPKLRFQMHIEYEDGSASDLISDESWKLTTNGPILANNEYDGEEYDARLEPTGWDKPGFNDASWQSAALVKGPEGALVAQMIPPIRVTQTLRPVALISPKPGLWIFDMGQNMVGWCRLSVAGPRGTQVSLRHAETLRPDGTLYLDNIRSAKVTDRYTLKGEGTEIYEPRFTYHGFRYVEVTGFPGTPTLASIEGRVVHDDLERTGEFACSNPLLNRIYQNILWGVRGNYRSFPTDCPQRDERQAWLGDRSAEAKGETYLYDIAGLYGKWMADIHDSQKPNGSVPDVAPPYWPLYSDNVTWPSSYIIIPGALYEQYADLRIIERHYPTMKKWIEHMRAFMKDDLMPRDTYGDWCVPPESQTLIHSKDPARKTAGEILGTTYFYHDVRLMARYATLLGKSDDAQQYATLAERMKAAFNRKYLKADLHHYDNGSQTSHVLPLAFGMVPEEHRAAIFASLVNKIENETHRHIGTGLVGGQWLNRVLSDNGRADLVYTLASQKTYPSWGYMIEKGATTIWELWNGDTADPAMNSGNHVMLVGDLNIFFHEYLAGIRPDPEKPGFKHIIIRPHPVGDLAFAKASHRSPYGWIRSEWNRTGQQFTLALTIPPNTTATVYLPAPDASAVREAGHPAAQSPGIRFLRMEQGAAVYAVGSGQYRFATGP